MRKEITETYYIDPDAFKSAGELAKELKKFKDWEYHGLCIYEGDYDILRLKFTATRMETDEEMNTKYPFPRSEKELCDIVGEWESGDAEFLECYWAEKSKRIFGE